jgi:thiol-disulfide isomerase/thioredoxin
MSEIRPNVINAIKRVSFVGAVGVGVLALGCSDEPGAIDVVLTPQAPLQEEGRSLRWSPKGEKLLLAQGSGGLTTNLRLGPDGTPELPIRLEKGDGQVHYNLLLIDHDRGGSFEDNEVYETTPEEIRGSMWSSFEAVVEIPSIDPEPGDQQANPYPLSFWFVDNPNEVEEELVLRFSRRGWMEGHATIDGVDAVVLLTENVMDGVFDSEDSWALASVDSAANVFSHTHSRPAERHAWLFEKAYRLSEIHPSGRKLVLTPFDPGVTRAEEAKIDDDLAEDRRAGRSGRNVAFLHDFGEAEALARAEGKPIFIDFETDWCGPCKVMDLWVYTADVVVDASLSYVPVKVDGDEHPDLKERFLVEGYPTMLVVDVDGTVMRRTAGYKNVAEMAEFLTGGEGR